MGYFNEKIKSLVLMKSLNRFSNFSLNSQAPRFFLLELTLARCGFTGL